MKDIIVTIIMAIITIAEWLVMLIPYLIWMNVKHIIHALNLMTIAGGVEDLINEMKY